MKYLKKEASKVKFCFDNTCIDIPKQTANIMIGGAAIALLLYAITK